MLCSISVLPSMGVTIKAPIAPAVIPDAKIYGNSTFSELFTSLKWFLNEANNWKKIIENGTSRDKVAAEPRYNPRIPRSFMTDKVEGTGWSEITLEFPPETAAICILIFTASMGFVAITCVVPANAPAIIPRPVGSLSGLPSAVLLKLESATLKKSFAASLIAFSGATPSILANRPKLLKI